MIPPRQNHSLHFVLCHLPPTCDTQRIVVSPLNVVERRDATPSLSVRIPVDKQKAERRKRRNGAKFEKGRKRKEVEIYRATFLFKIWNNRLRRRPRRIEKFWCFCVFSKYTASRLHRHRIYGLSGYMVNFWLVPNGMGYHTIKYFGYMVKISQNFGYMVNFIGIQA